MGGNRKKEWVGKKRKWNQNGENSGSLRSHVNDRSHRDGKRGTMMTTTTSTSYVLSLLSAAEWHTWSYRSPLTPSFQKHSQFFCNVEEFLPADPSESVTLIMTRASVMFSSAFYSWGITRQWCYTILFPKFYEGQAHIWSDCCRTVL